MFTARMIGRELNSFPMRCVHLLQPGARYQLPKSLILSAMLTPELAIPIGRATKSMNFVMSTEGWREA